MFASLPLVFASLAFAYDYDLPGLPVRIALSGSAPLCRSRELHAELAYRFLRVVGAGDSRDLSIECEESSDAFVLNIYGHGHRGVRRISVERSEGTRDAQTAFLAANAAAKSSVVIEAALDIYVARNADLGAAGSDDFSREDWPRAIEHLGQALESDLNAAPLYFGLYKANAELGRPDQAKWYLEAFLKASGRKASELTDEQVMPLIRVQASGSTARSLADGRFHEYEQLARSHQWHAALYKLKEIVALAPWYEPAYVSLAQSYDRIGWKRLVPIWRARASFVRKLNKDGDLGKAVVQRLDALDE